MFFQNMPGVFLLNLKKYQIINLKLFNVNEQFNGSNKIIIH